MAKRCPLSSQNAPGFYFHESIPDICEQTCETLWNQAINAGKADHEEYPESILSIAARNCTHQATEHGSSSLQAVAIDSAVRLYGITERCLSCDEEIAELLYV